MESTEIYTIKYSYFSDKYTAECHLQILELRHKWTTYIKPLAIYFQNAYIYNVIVTGYLNISHLLIYIKDIKDTEKKLCENNAKRRKKFNKAWTDVLINEVKLNKF